MIINDIQEDKKEILRCFSQFLRDVEHLASGALLRLDSSKGYTGSLKTRVFCKCDLIRILEASD